MDTDSHSTYLLGAWLLLGAEISEHAGKIAICSILLLPVGPAWDQFTTSWPFMPRSRWVRPPTLTSHETSNVPFCAGVNLISALFPGCSFTYLTPVGASTSMSAPSISRSWEPRYCDAIMWGARPVLTTFSVTALPAFSVT